MAEPLYRPSGTWTPAAPERPGWYWLRSPGGSQVRVVHVLGLTDALDVYERSGAYPLADYTAAGYSFAGPIPEPEG